MTKLVLFNAPPQVGKDTAADYLVKKYGVTKLQMKDELYTLTSCLLHTKKSDFLDLATDNVKKDVKQIDFNGQLKSPRDMLIFVSETVVKPNFGKSWFGDSVAHKINNVVEVNEFFGEKVIVMSDCGFYDEVYSIIKKCNLSPEDVTLVRIHKDGHDFSNDSRSYVYFDKEVISTSMDIYNNDTLDVYLNKIDEIFMGIFKK